MYPEITIAALEAFHGMSLDRTPKLPSPVVTVAPAAFPRNAEPLAVVTLAPALAPNVAF